MTNANVLDAFSGNGASPGGSKIKIPNYADTKIPVHHAPPGSYPAVVTGFKEARSKAGNDMFVISLEVDVGGNKILSRIFHCTIVVPSTANSLGKIAQTFLALDVPSDVEIDASAIVGRPCTANVSDGNEYLGKPSSNIDSIDPPGQATGAIATVDTAGPALDTSEDLPF